MTAPVRPFINRVQGPTTPPRATVNPAVYKLPGITPDRVERLLDAAPHVRSVDTLTDDRKDYLSQFAKPGTPVGGYAAGTPAESVFVNADPGAYKKLLFSMLESGSDDGRTAHPPLMTSPLGVLAHEMGHTLRRAEWDKPWPEPPQPEATADWFSDYELRDTPHLLETEAQPQDGARVRPMIRRKP